MHAGGAHLMMRTNKCRPVIPIKLILPNEYAESLLLKFLLQNVLCGPNATKVYLVPAPMHLRPALPKTIETNIESDSVVAVRCLFSQTA